MRGKHEEQPVDRVQVPEVEYIGHITTPIEQDQERMLTILKQHGVTVLKCPTDDNWWTLLLPPRTTRTVKEVAGRSSTYTVQLPDGYSFLYRVPVFKIDKSYDTLPMVDITKEEQQE
jgi:hypothetical protein